MSQSLIAPSDVVNTTCCDTLRGMKGLKNWMESTGTTQVELGKRVGIGQNAVSMIVNGKRQPSFGVALKLAKVTGMGIAELVMGPKPTPRRRRA